GAFQPLLVDKLHLSLKQAGILGGLLIFFSSVMQPAYGYLSDRFHTRMFSALAPAMAGIFISLLVVAPTYGWLLVMAALGGAGIASFHPQASAWATAGIEANKGRWMAIFISAGTLGMAFGPTYFSTIVAVLGATQARWAAVPGVLTTIALLMFLPMAPAPEPHLRNRVNWAVLRSVWKPLTVLYFLVFIRSIIQITFAQFLPLYLHQERGFSITDANYALSLYLTFGALGGFAGGHLADRFGGRRIIMISMIGCVPFLALFFLGQGIAAMAGLAGGGLLLLFTIPVNVVMAQELAPGQAGTVSALMMGFAWGMAGLLFVPLTGFLSDTWSLHSTLSALLVFPLIGFFLTFGLKKSNIA
ncbi:MAG TPA: MFS transporter, partial [Bryobacteraceae bacterium]|nr:MFS transporter [Bryobacteraceae bacterium]